MTSSPAITEGFISVRGYRTWYRIVGERAGPAHVPVLLVHGGPGIPSVCLEPVAALAATGRPVIFYDQLGCGNSDRPEDPSLWCIEHFLHELTAIRTALRLDRVHLLGFSWGGTLALEYALTKPRGMTSLILHSTYASTAGRIATEQRARTTLPRSVQAALRRHEAAGTTNDPAYQAARRIFDLQYICRIDPWPDFLQRAIAEANFAVGAAMESRDDRHAPGGWAHWDITPHLGEIHIPTLVIGGRHDGFMAGQDEILRDGIAGAVWERFEASSHYAHAEEPERFLSVLDAFLTRVEHEDTP